MWMARYSAQPLYLPSVSVPGRGDHNVLYVATMNDKVYAFDADKPGRRCGCAAYRRDWRALPRPVTDITNNSELNLVGNVGIEISGAIDRAANAIFLVARTRESGKYVQRLHKMMCVMAGFARACRSKASRPSTGKDAAGWYTALRRRRPAISGRRSGAGEWRGYYRVGVARGHRPYHGW